MRTALRLPAVLLASGLVATSLLPAPASGADDASRAQRVTYDVGTGARGVRSARARRAAAAGERARPGAPAASGASRDEERSRPRKVFGGDDRFEVGDPTIYPWSAVCRVIAEFPDGSVVQGSAALIGDRFALTAGHVVYDADAGGFAERVEVVPAYDGGDAPFGAFVAEDVTSFAGWTRDHDYDWDFALLTLDGAPGGETGWLGLAARGDSDLAGATVNTAGYPSDLDDAEFQYGATGTVSRVLPGQLEMKGTFDAAGGQSGSGVWQKTDDVRHVVGVLSTETSTANRAARVTDAVFDALVEWMDEADGPDLAVTDVSAALPREFAAPYSTSVAVTVENQGATDATVLVEVAARDLLGNRTVLASRTAFVAAGATRGESFTLAFPEAFAGGTYLLEASVNGDGAVPDTDPANDVRDGVRFVVLPPYEALGVGTGDAAALGPGGVLRYRIDVPDGMRNLRLRLRAPNRTVATVTRPDGKVFYVRPSAFGTRFRRPMAGTWLVDLRASLVLRRVRTVAFNAGGR